LLAGWAALDAAIAALARRQLFFVGGAPRSGTTWLQQMLDAHPDVSCKGEGLFWKELAAPLGTLMGARRRALEAKNSGIFARTGGYPLPPSTHEDLLLGTGILAALAQQCGGRDCRAVGEKTPENVFFFPKLKGLFPAAKFIGIARDPRDVLASAWHFFHQAAPGEDEAAARIDFVRMALPSLAEGMRAMLTLEAEYPGDCMLVTYEALHEAPAGVMARLFAFLGVPDGNSIVMECVAAKDAFMRTGQVGLWPNTLNAETNDMIVQQTGWAFARFGWMA
jgi:hypothetical protein